MQPSRDCNMRKYQQAVVTGIGFLTTILFLYYKHEYDRLRSVMEVMEVFGDPHGRNLSKSEFCRAELPHVSLPDSAARYLLDSAGSSWQRIGESLFVYSAYSVSTADGPSEVVVLGASAPVNFKSLVDAELFFGSSSQKVSAKVDVLKSMMTSDEEVRSGYDWQPIFLVFKKIENPHTPIKIKFNSGASVAVISEANTKMYGVRSHSSATSMTTCFFLASESGKDVFSTLTAAFAYYESAADIREFWVYGSNELSHRDSSVVFPAAWESGLALGVLPWNFPFHGGVDKQRNLALVDCALRSNNRRHKMPGTVIISKPDEFVVPRIHHTLSAILDAPDENTGVLRLSFTPTYFCPKNDGIAQNPLDGKEGLMVDQEKVDLVFQFSSAEQLFRAAIQGFPVVKNRVVPVAVGAVLLFPEACDDRIASKGKISNDLSLFKFKKTIEKHEIIRHKLAFTKFL
ncbi:unnamed protein product [Notodromas monacha]|uniref:Uncharacterized protein n=1 Tax=Notodromas monacha TaxID=399045 RepID=A0A7R9BJD8_9CRUS|nr:unnamed protein product [Notodromas monacha]CAG0916300.1 unnamed protein product [Notodromas monacha]